MKILLRPGAEEFAPDDDVRFRRGVHMWPICPMANLAFNPGGREGRLEGWTGRHRKQAFDKAPFCARLEEIRSEPAANQDTQRIYND